MKNSKIYILAICLTVVLTGCSLGLVKKTNKPITNNIATTTGKIATTTESNIASSTADMRNWKTYSNKIIGIEFKYPPTWPTLTKDNVGDEPINDLGNMFRLNLVDSTLIYHIKNNYDNLPTGEQFSKIQCSVANSGKMLLRCEDRISNNGVKYVWMVGRTPDGKEYSAYVATGKYLLNFIFQGDENYNRRAGEYQQLLSSLRIPE